MSYCLSLSSVIEHIVYYVLTRGREKWCSHACLMGVQLCNFCEDTFVIGIKMLHICVYLCMYTYIHTFIYIYKVHTHTFWLNSSISRNLCWYCWTLWNSTHMGVSEKHCLFPRIWSNLLIDGREVKSITAQWMLPVKITRQLHVHQCEGSQRNHEMETASCCHLC